MHSPLSTTVPGWAHCRSVHRPLAQSVFTPHVALMARPTGGGDVRSDGGWSDSLGIETTAERCCLSPMANPTAKATASAIASTTSTVQALRLSPQAAACWLGQLLAFSGSSSTLQRQSLTPCRQVPITDTHAWQQESIVASGMHSSFEQAFHQCVDYQSVTRACGMHTCQHQSLDGGAHARCASIRSGAAPSWPL